jgi:redox-sensitive bicupin YhaK (pirin superfamily)
MIQPFVEKQVRGEPKRRIEEMKTKTDADKSDKTVKTPSVRAIKKVWKSRPTIEGAGVHLKRAFGFHEVPLFDPFLLLDDFRSGNPEDYRRGFPWHPHRGIETITYVLNGEVEHQDSMGNGGVITSGDLQWMTAGSGILHQEMPKGDRKGRMDGFQLWANLPAKHKMMDPRYRDVKSGTVPVVKMEDGATIRVIAGEVDGVPGPVQDIVIDPEYLDVTLPLGKTFTHPVKAGHTVFAYVLEGEAYFEPGRDPYAHEAVGANYFDLKIPCSCPTETLILYGSGDRVSVTTEAHPVRFLLVSGHPLLEPVAWYGPIVMNTKEELRIAFEEFDKGTFVKHSSRDKSG